MGTSSTPELSSSGTMSHRASAVAERTCPITTACPAVSQSRVSPDLPFDLLHIVVIINEQIIGSKKHQLRSYCRYHAAAAGSAIQRKYSSSTISGMLFMEW